MIFPGSSWCTIVKVKVKTNVLCIATCRIVYQINILLMVTNEKVTQILFDIEYHCTLELGHSVAELHLRGDLA